MPYKDRSKLYETQKRHRIRVRIELFSFLSQKKCIDCGEKDPVVLEFDHKIRAKKFKGVASMLAGHYSWKSVLAEIQKCDIRCANCHRRKTYVELGGFGRTKPL